MMASSPTVPLVRMLTAGMVGCAVVVTLALAYSCSAAVGSVASKIASWSRPDTAARLAALRHDLGG